MVRLQWFECFEMLRKVLLVGFIAFFFPGTPSQVVCAMLVTLVALCVTGYVISSPCYSSTPVCLSSPPRRCVCGCVVGSYVKPYVSSCALPW